MGDFEIIGIILALGLVEFITGFLFNLKIYYIKHSKHKIAAVCGSVSLTMFMLIAALIALVTTQLPDTGFWTLGFTFISPIFIGLGNYGAGLLMHFYNKKQENKEKDNE